MEETRLVIYTNDAAVLALSDFPFSVYQWKTKSTSTQSVRMRVERPTFRLKERRVRQLQSRKVKAAYTVEGWLDSIPGDFSPKIDWMHCVTEEPRSLTFAKETIHRGFSTEGSYQGFISSRIDDVWKQAQRYRRLMDLELEPRYKTPSVLLLEAIDGDAGRARDVGELWGIWDSVMGCGNSLTRTPICEIVTRVETSRRVWEYRLREEPLEGKKGFQGRLN